MLQLKESEVKYLLSLLDDLTEDIYDEVMTVYYDICEEKTPKAFSADVIQFFKLNLLENPVTVTRVLTFLLESLEDKNVRDMIQELYLDTLQNKVNTSNAEELISLLCLFKFDDAHLPTLTEKILSKVRGDVLTKYKKQIYISLITQNRPELLTLCFQESNDDQNSFKLSPDYMLELAYVRNQHWLLKLLDSYRNQSLNVQKFNFKLNNFSLQLALLRLLDLINGTDTSNVAQKLNYIKNIFTILNSHKMPSKQLEYYITELYREYVIIKFCIDNNFKTLSMNLFHQALRQSTLSIVSQLCHLASLDRYKLSRLLLTNNEMLDKLDALSNSPQDKKHTDILSWDSMVYNSYSLLTMVMDYIINSTKENKSADENIAILDDVKLLLLSLQPVSYCIEIMENVFSCLFLRFEYFSCIYHEAGTKCNAHSDCSYFVSKKAQTHKHGEQNNIGFMCNSVSAQNILSLLKECIDKVQADNRGGLEEVDSVRINNILRLVNDSLWKLQLVSNIAPDQHAVSLKLCLDYAFDFGVSSEDDEFESATSKKKIKAKRKHTSNSGYNEHMSSSVDVLPNTPPRVSDFISMMLASPNSLISLALHHNDFSRANQIIALFELADTDIAVEVTFIENFKELVRKMKQIIMCKVAPNSPLKGVTSFSLTSANVTSLVEGFLSSVRTPSYHDVIELAQRQPCLRIYEPKNSALVNVIDILIATGQTRDVTYGLISIIESKLSELKNIRDSSKKYDYVKFIHDMVSIMFEIYGKNDGIQLYADNICGVLNDCKIPMRHKDFNAKLNQYFNELEAICGELSPIMDLESISNCPIAGAQKLHQSFMNMVSILDKDLCNLFALMPTGNFKPRLRYLKTSYVYMKNVFQLESENVESAKGSQENSYFSVLPRALHVLVGDLVYKMNVPIARLETICKKLKINLIHKLLLNFCSPIKVTNRSTDDEESFNTLLQMVYNYKHMEEDLFVEPNVNFSPHFHDIDQVSLTYILHNWVVAYLLRQVHAADVKVAASQDLDVRTTYLDNYLNLQRFEYSKILFGDNKVFTALHSVVDTNELFKFMTKLVESGKLLRCMHIIDALPESTVLECPNILNLRDLILVTLTIHPNVEYNWRFCYHICAELRNDLILNNLSCWPTAGALSALQFLRYTKGCEGGVVAKCEEWIDRVPVYDQIASLMSLESWYTVYEKSIENPEEVIQYLMDNHQFAICLNWANLHDVSSSMKYLIISSLLKQLFEYTNQATPNEVADLLEQLPTSQAIDIIQSNISKIKNIDILKTVIDFLNKHGENWRNYENIKIGLQIMSRIDLNRRQLFWEIVDKPLLIIEQFLMNAKLETLKTVINHITPLLKCDPEGDDLYYNHKSIHKMVISKNSVDALLRIYAEKALDMKLSKLATSALLSPIKTSPEMLMQSLDSINFEVTNGPFVMPDEVPSKEQWVDNCASTKCMVCHIAIFSMLIRRHHCRRCGRLVCHACSRNRLHVPSYPETLKVRVCDDCSKEMVQSRVAPDADRKTSSCGESGVSGTTSMDWCLSADNRRNEEVRKEFTFEFTPNVTLCLSIMNMHSINLDYPRFLLDRSDELASAVTHAAAASRLLLRARRALLLAAAELYTRAPDAQLADAGAGHAQRRLAHADALALLVKHNCQHLLPAEDALPGHYVRRMLEVEKWDLALEIATKSGLPRTGVLAAWGKACLKAGCFRQAREKFSHCFKSTVATIASEWVEDCEFGREAAEVSPLVNRTISKMLLSDRTNSLTSIQSESLRPRVNPPLLNEIISILENINYSVNSQLVARAESIQATNEKLAAVHQGNKKLALQEPALNIMHALSSIQKIKQADYSDFCIVPQKKPRATGLLRRPAQNETKFDKNYNKLNPYFFKECTFYLTDYGSHSGNISFYLKHSSLSDVLKYCCDNVVEKEIFTESVYLECLRRGKVSELLRCMSELNGSWENWTEYLINTCRVLESTGRLDALYNLQCVVGEHARAAATCARLYTAVAPSGTSGAALVTSLLKARQHHLTASRGHLLQCTPSENIKNYPSNSLYLQLDKTILDKHITTISRQMEVVEFLSKCGSKKQLTDKVFRELVPVPTSTSRPEGTAQQPLTLFGSHSDKMKLAALCIFCGQNVDEGFGLADKIIADSKLDAMRVYSHVVRYLVKCKRFIEIKTLGKCIKARPDGDGSLMSDQVLEMGVAAIVRQCDTHGQLFDEQAELLIEDIHSITIKISCYIECRILSTAYILAAKHNRTSELKRILREAERLGHEKVRNACVKRLSAKNLL